MSAERTREDGAVTIDGSPDRGDAGRPRGPARVLLFIVAFGSGFAALTVEFAGARLIAPVFGLSAVPWTAVIGTILAALAAGSHLGGRLADGGRVPLSGVLAAAGLAGGIPLIGQDVPWLARDALGFVGGALASAAVLFAPAALCLGAVVPYLVRADTESLERVGRRAGDVSATATAGSIAGAFLTGFVLLPAFPVPVLIGLTSAAMLGLAWLAGRALGRPPPGEMLALGALGVGVLGYATARTPADTLVSLQTPYATVSVTEREWAGGRRVRELWQNGGSSSAEYVDTGAPAHAYVRVSGLLLEPVLDRFDSALVLGGAALSLPVALERWRPGIRVDVVEIDPAVTELARAHFAYGREPRPRIRVAHDDARVFLRSAERRWGVIYLDVFDHLLTVPWTVVTVEAFRDAEARLAPGGLLMANVLTPLGGPGVALLQRLQATALEVFGVVRVYPTDPSADPLAIQNAILVAARVPSDLPRVDRPTAAPGPAGRPLTDAWAPVEYLQARIFLEGVRWR